MRCEFTEDGVGGVHGDLVFRGIADEPLGVGECHVRRRRTVALVVGDDLHAIMLPHSDARVRRPEVDSDRRSLAFSGHYLRRKSQKEFSTIDEKQKRRKRVRERIE